MKIFLTCPICGKAEWCIRDDGFKCLNCGEIADIESMCSKVQSESEEEND